MTQDADAIYRDAVAMQGAGRLLEALTRYEEALAARPTFAQAQCARAHLLWTLERRVQALVAVEAAIALQPNFAEAHFNRGFMLQQERRLAAALDSYSRAIMYKPGLIAAWNNRAGLLQAMRRFPEALKDLEQVLILAPNAGRAHYNRGTILMELDRLDEAQESFSRALALEPDHPDAFGCLITAAIGACDWQMVAKLKPRMLTEVAAGKSVVPPVIFLGQCDDLALQRRCAETTLRALMAQTSVTPLPVVVRAKPNDDRPLRLAYMSSDFGSHPVAMQIVELLERHDRSRFEVRGIALGPGDGSDLHARVIRACDTFHDVTAQSDGEAADLLRRMDLDILVDLNGQTMGWRPGVLSQRPAPVQVSFLGYAGTTGARFIDYLIADGHTVPPEQESHYSESIVRMPHCFWPSDSKRSRSPATGRAENGLPEDGLVFCAFNNHHKIGDALFACWMRILGATPDSVLWLRAAPGAVQRNLRRAAEAHGIGTARLLFAPLVRAEIHLGRQGLADLFLDTFPYNAHSSASDALWMGLPLITCRGHSFASRVASSMLHALDLSELVTESLPEYETLAIALARDRARLGALRARLAANLHTAPLFDSARFRADLETAYLAMWRLARSGDAPRSFTVGSIRVAGEMHPPPLD